MKVKNHIENEYAAGCARVSCGCVVYHGALQYYAHSGLIDPKVSNNVGVEGRRRALLSVPFGYASLHCEQGTPIPLANDLQLFNFRWQSLFKFGWQWTRGSVWTFKDADTNFSGLMDSKGIDSILFYFKGPDRFQTGEDSIMETVMEIYYGTKAKISPQRHLEGGPGTYRRRSRRIHYPSRNFLL